MSSDFCWKITRERVERALAVARERERESETTNLNPAKTEQNSNNCTVGR